MIQNIILKNEFLKLCFSNFKRCVIIVSTYSMMCHVIVVIQ
jgi:hypothetical protein